MYTIIPPGRRWSRRFLVMGVFLAALAGLRADETPAGVLSFSVSSPAGKHSLSEIHNIVLRSAIDRTWTIKHDTENKIVGYLNHRKVEATVTFLVSDTLVQAYCEGYAVDGNGTRKGAQQPVKWLQYLKEDITRGIDPAAFPGKK